MSKEKIIKEREGCNDADDFKGIVSLLKAGCDMNIEHQHVTTALKKDTNPKFQN